MLYVNWFYQILVRQLFLVKIISRCAFIKIFFGKCIIIFRYDMINSWRLMKNCSVCCLQHYLLLNPFFIQLFLCVGAPCLFRDCWCWVDLSRLTSRNSSWGRPWTKSCTFYFIHSSTIKYIVVLVLFVLSILINSIELQTNDIICYFSQLYYQF